MTGCCVTGCSNSYRNGYRMFRFPTNKERRKKWAEKCKRKDWEPTVNHRICSVHFDESQFNPFRGKTKLRKDALPTLFNSPDDPPSVLVNDHEIITIVEETESPLPNALFNESENKVPACSAVNCSYKPGRHEIPGKSMHRFPFSQPDILKQWIKNVRRKNWKPSLISVLCNSHFEEKCFNRNGCLIQLKPDAVPTIFDYSSAAEKDSKLHSKRKGIASNADDLLDGHLLSTKRIAKANMRVKNTSPVLSEESEYNYCSFPGFNQDSVSDQTKEHAAEPETIHLNKNLKSNLNRNVKSPFRKLSRRLNSIKKPSKWWGITRHNTFIMCTKWNEAYVAERKIIIDRNLNVKVFLYNFEVTNPELKKLQNAKDLTKILYQVDSYRIIPY